MCFDYPFKEGIRLDRGAACEILEITYGICPQIYIPVNLVIL